MTIVEYIIRKNKIIFEETGVVLVPEGQIVETPMVTSPLAMTSDGDFCPYCEVFGQDMDYDCEGCPMYEADNYCNDSDSSWKEVKESLWVNSIFLSKKLHPKLKKLVEEFNISNGLV